MNEKFYNNITCKNNKKSPFQYFLYNKVYLQRFRLSTLEGHHSINIFYVYLKSVPNLGYLIFVSGILYIKQSTFIEVSTKHPWGTPFYTLNVYLKSVPNLGYLIFISGKLYIENSIFTEVSTRHPWGTPFYVF